MTLSPSTVSLIQKAGAAIYEAREEVTMETRSQVERLTLSMATDPFSLGTDSLFERWKSLSRLDKELEEIDLRLRTIHLTMSTLICEAAQALKAEPLQLTNEVAIQRLRGRSAVQLPVEDVQTVSEMADTPTDKRLRGNNAKLFVYLRGVLSPTEFTHLHQSNAAQQTGIPSGSMGYAIKQLVIKGLILEGTKGVYKLA